MSECRGGAQQMSAPTPRELIDAELNSEMKTSDDLIRQAATLLREAVAIEVKHDQSWRNVRLEVLWNMLSLSGQALNIPSAADKTGDVKRSIAEAAENIGELF